MGTIRNARTGLWHLRHGGHRAWRTWRRKQRVGTASAGIGLAKGAEGAWKGRGADRRLSFSPAQLPERQPRRSDLRVAVILDDFSSLAFSYEWTSVPINPKSWREQLSAEPVDLLFVESAWAGNGGQWKYQLTGASGPKSAFLELMDWCRSKGVPTAFWNKEDPPHYDDFLSAAKLFDFVFTSDSNRIPAYIEDLGHERVHVLPFAAQPAIHNPIRPLSGWHERDVAFAGMYFAHKYPERRAQMDLLLGGVVQASAKMETGLDIFSRQLGGEGRYQFPNHFQDRVVGSLTYRQMLTAYKGYKLFLNVNSVVDSPSMCARRIFEIIASGAAVMTTPSAATGRYFNSDELAIVASKEEAQHMARALVRSPELSDRLVHKAQRKIWAEHTYAHRAEDVIMAALPGEGRPVTVPTVSAVVSTIRPHQLEHVFRMVGSQLNADRELILLTHGFEAPQAVIERLRERYGIDNFVALNADKRLTLGECLNRCVDAASGTVVTKMDDDDHYGPHYLADQLHALSYSNAEIVGKQAHYMYVEAKNATLLRFPQMEHRFTHLVMGPTLMGARDVFMAHPFQPVTSGEDTRFLASVAADEGAIYSADRYNYFQHRKDAGHTWDIETENLLASASVSFFGSPVQHVTV